jgi:hypothetical protein
VGMEKNETSSRLCPVMSVVTSSVKLSCLTTKLNHSVDLYY